MELAQKDIEVRKLSKSNFRSLAVFLCSFKVNETEDYWLERFHHWWVENPSFNKESFMGSILISKDGIVGFVGNIPTTFILDKNLLNVANITTWRVDDNYKYLSLKLFAHYLSSIKSQYIFTTTPNEVVRRLLPRYDFETIKQPYDTDIVFNIHTKFSNIFFNNRLLRFVPKSLETLFFFLLFVSRKINLYSKCSKSKLVLKFESSISEMHTLSNNFSKNYDLINLRNKETLNWYSNSPCSKKTFLTCYDGDRLVAYFCLRHYLEEESALEIFDFLYHSDYVNNLNLFILSILNYSYIRRFSKVIFVGYNDDLALSAKNFLVKRLVKHKKKEFVKVPFQMKKRYPVARKFFTRTIGDIGL